MLTVGRLKKALKGVDNKTPIYLADHDHSEWETNGTANDVRIVNQDDFDEWTQKKLEKEPQFKIKGTYIVISVG